MKIKNEKINKSKKVVESRFKSLIIEKDFEPENPKQLEELDENSCKWPIGHPMKKIFIFVEEHLSKIFLIVNFIYYMLTNLKGKKDDNNDKEDLQEYIEKKIQTR